MKKIITLLSLVALFSGCAVFLDKIPTEYMMEDLSYCGFSVKRPTDSRWYLYKSEQAPLIACFRRDGSSHMHSAYTMMNVSSLNTWPKTIDEFEKIWRAEKTQTSGRMKLQEYTSSQTMKQGQWCIEYSLKTLDTTPINSASPLVMTMKGFVVIHPSWTNAVLDAYISQRGKEDELNVEIDNSGKSILDGVRLESAPG